MRTDLPASGIMLASANRTTDEYAAQSGVILSSSSFREGSRLSSTEKVTGDEDEEFLRGLMWVPSMPASNMQMLVYKLSFPVKFQHFLLTYEAVEKILNDGGLLRGDWDLAQLAYLETDKMLLVQEVERQVGSVGEWALLSPAASARGAADST